MPAPEATVVNSRGLASSRQILIFRQEGVESGNELGAPGHAQGSLDHRERVGRGRVRRDAAPLCAAIDPQIASGVTIRPSSMLFGTLTQRPPGSLNRNRAPKESDWTLV
jgi:hypothetical protein